MSRRQPNMRTLLASALLCIPQRDSFGKPLLDSSGFLVPAISFADSQKMTEKQIRAAFDFDHVNLKCWGGNEHPSNLVPRLRAEHILKTAKRDAKEIAKVRRAEKKRDQMKVTNDLPTINTILDKLPKHAPDRRKAVIPGSKRSPYRKKVNGTVERRP